MGISQQRPQLIQAASASRVWRVTAPSLYSLCFSARKALSRLVCVRDVAVMPTASRSHSIRVLSVTCLAVLFSDFCRRRGCSKDTENASSYNSLACGLTTADHHTEIQSVQKVAQVARA